MFPSLTDLRIKSKEIRYNRDDVDAIADKTDAKGRSIERG